MDKISVRQNIGCDGQINGLTGRHGGWVHANSSGGQS